jgi:hypothetical protein
MKTILIPLLSAVFWTFTTPAEVIYVTSGPQIARFDSANPTSVTSVPVTGLQPGETVRGIDVRPTNQELYAIGTTGRLYVIDPLTGDATAVGGPSAALAAGSGFDFNPVTDQARVITGSKMNYRVDPTNGTLASTDSNLSSTDVNDIAYSNNVPGGGGSTTLYGVDTSGARLVTIGGPGGSPSPDLGSIIAVAPLSVTPDHNSDHSGFDISGSSGTAFVSLVVGNVDHLYTLNLSTGAATLVGTIGNGATQYTSLAAANAPEPTSATLIALPVAVFLARFRRRRA